MKIYSYLNLVTLLSLSFGCVSPPSGEKSNPVITKGAPLEDGYKFCVIGDAGSGQAGQQKVATFLAKENCKSVYYVGDVIYEKGLKNADDKQFQTKFYNPYKPLLEGGVPFHMIMGNHDHDGNVDAWITLAQRYPGKIIYPYYYYAEDYGDVCFVGIDTDIPLLSNDNTAQYNWTNQTLDQLQNNGCKLSFSFSHHPFISSGDYGEAEPEIKSFLSGTVLGRTDVYMTGHDHLLADEMTEEGTRLLISGGGGQDLYEVQHPRPGAFAKSVPGYITFTIHRENNVVSAQYQLVEILNGVRTVILSRTVTGLGIRSK